jgi:uncharacterized membrane protein
MLPKPVAMVDPRPPLRILAQRALGAFLTGLVFLLPFILTIILLDWAAGYVRAAVGPESFIGSAMASGGSVLVGGRARALAFWVGLGLVLVAIGVLGAVVQTRVRRRMEDGLDSFIDRVPVLRSIYRPIAQIVRLLGPQSGTNLEGMRVVAVRFGEGADTLALLVSPDLFDVGGQPRQLVMLTTAPVPVGGALLFVPPQSVIPVDGLSVEDFVKFFVSVGVVRPAGLRPYVADAAPR